MIKFVIILVLIILDFLSKKIIHIYIDLNSFVTILPVIDLTHIYNYGISFGLFSGIIPKWGIVSISIVITIIIFIMYTKTSKNIEKWSFIFIISGAISNILDRIMNNHVLDFILLHYRNFYWPAFNFADIYITFGLFILLYSIIHEFIKK